MIDPVQQDPVYYSIMSSPIGELLVAAIGTEVVHLAFENHDFRRVRAQLAETFGGPVVHDDPAVAFATKQLEEYFAGTRQTFDLAIRQPPGQRFLTTVQQQLVTIPYGQTRSYGELAQQLDRPGAARAVGTACAKNPIPVIQPCHRVVRADGSFGEFSGLPGAKAYLVAFERGEQPDAPTS